MTGLIRPKLPCGFFEGRSVSTPDRNETPAHEVIRSRSHPRRPGWYAFTPQRQFLRPGASCDPQLYQSVPQPARDGDQSSGGRGGEGYPIPTVDTSPARLARGVRPVGGRYSLGSDQAQREAASHLTSGSGGLTSTAVVSFSTEIPLRNGAQRQRVLSPSLW